MKECGSFAAESAEEAAQKLERPMFSQEEFTATKRSGWDERLLALFAPRLDFTEEQVWQRHGQVNEQSKMEFCHFYASILHRSILKHLRQGKNDSELAEYIWKLRKETALSTKALVLSLLFLARCYFHGAISLHYDNIKLFIAVCMRLAIKYYDDHRWLWDEEIVSATGFSRAMLNFMELHVLLNVFEWRMYVSECDFYVLLEYAFARSPLLDQPVPMPISPLPPTPLPLLHLASSRPSILMRSKRKASSTSPEIIKRIKTLH